MDEQKIIRKTLLKNTFINFIIFTTILLVFDIIIYNHVKGELFRTVDMQLQETANRISSAEAFSLDGRNRNGEIDREQIRPAEEDVEREELSREDIENFSPRMITIVRDLDGNLENEEGLGILEDYLGEINFDENNLEQIYNIEISQKYEYRGINFKFVNENDEEKYMQILINIDGETTTMENLFNILIIGTIALIIISIIFSYILSKRSIKPLIDAYRKQTEFVQNASHELRTPLTIIQAKQELLLQNPNSKIIDKSQDINLTLKETKRLSKLIKDLMELARADSNKYPLEKADINIDELIKETTMPYVELAKIQNKTLNLDLNYNSTIKGNRDKLVELLIIILDNAIKYTKSQDVITIKTSKKDKKCLLEIIDTGIGVDKKELENIFDRFYRTDKAHSKETGGTGLGLSIAKTIVTMHNGTIKAINNEPKGLIIQIKI